MRRIAGTLAVVVCAAALAAARGGGTETYRVDAIFDSAAFLIPGQDVKVAGSRVGTVEAVDLTRGRRARVEMAIEPGFAPFRTDARCAIRPQSLIGEKFVDCRPGTPAAPALRGDAGAPPTVPLARTRSPVDLDLVFSSLRRPYVERLSLIVSELGTGLAGRPAALEAAVRRAAPALAESERVLRILNRDRARLRRLVDHTDTVVAELAARDRDAARLIDRAAIVARSGARRRAELGQTLDRLPPLLAELEPSATRLAAVARDARPVLAEVRAATPALRDLWGDLEPLTVAARPALGRLSAAAATARRAVRAARPVGRRLRAAAVLLPRVVDITHELVNSLRASGAVEGIQSFLRVATLATARFDRISHMAPSYQVTGICQEWTAVPVKECDAHFAGYRGDRGGLAPRRPGAPAPPAGAPRGAPLAPLRPPSGLGLPGPSGSLPAAPDRAHRPGRGLPGIPQLSPTPVPDDIPRRLLDYLLGP